MKKLLIILLLSAGCTKLPLNDQDKPGLLTTTCSNCTTYLGNKVGSKIYFRYAADTLLNIHVTDSARVRVFNRVNVQLWDTIITRDSRLTYRFKNQ